MTKYHSPLEQFNVKEIIPLYIGNYNIAITNSSLMMVVIVLSICLSYTIAIRSVNIVPSRIQVSAEFFYRFINNMTSDIIGSDGYKFTPLVFSVFMFILICNLTGMIPYAFTVTSNISVTLTFSIMLFFITTILGVKKNGFGFFRIFVPKDIPIVLMPLMIMIKVCLYFAKPFTLALRLTANMVAGHVLIKIIAGSVITLVLILKLLPIPILVGLILFEIAVAILQAYLFSILTCTYISDVINLH